MRKNSAKLEQDKRVLSVNFTSARPKRETPSHQSQGRIIFCTDPAIWRENQGHLAPPADTANRTEYYAQISQYVAELFLEVTLDNIETVPRIAAHISILAQILDESIIESLARNIGEQAMAKNLDIDSIYETISFLDEFINNRIANHMADI